jgi:hypothetical protein
MHTNTISFTITNIAEVGSTPVYDILIKLTVVFTAHPLLWPTDAEPQILVATAYRYSDWFAPSWKATVAAKNQELVILFM